MSDWTTARVVRDRDGDMWGREREGWNLISAENTEAWYPSDTCAGPQCRRKVDARGLCKAHYMQAWKGRQLTILVDKHALPPGWNIPTPPARMPLRPGEGRDFYDAARIGPVAPPPPAVVAQWRAAVVALGASDLLPMLGLDDPQTGTRT